MISEEVFRWSLAAVLVTGLGVSLRFRKRADRVGGAMARRADGPPLLMAAMALCGFGLIGGLLVYVAMPSLMRWSQLDLPSWLRLTGVAIALPTLWLFYRVFAALGLNVTPTAQTRERATLITHGPYRFVRHPMYTAGLLLLAAFVLITANWFIGLMGVGSFVVLVIRTHREEANLIEKFGDDYRGYAARTPRLIPRFTRAGTRS